MLKFSKYFFVLFLAVTVLPMAFMFCWNHHEISKFAQAKEEFMLDNGTKQLEFFAQEYLQDREQFIVRTVKDLSPNNVSIEQYKNIFDADNIYLIKSDIKSKNNFLNIKREDLKKNSSYYDIVYKNNTPSLVAVVIVPLDKAGKKALVVADKVSVDEFNYNGPFDLELYEGNKIQSNKLIGMQTKPFLHKTRKYIPPAKKLLSGPQRIKEHPMIHPEDPFMPPHMRDDFKPGFNPEKMPPYPGPFERVDKKHQNSFEKDMPYIDRSNSFKTLELKNNSDKTIATLLLRSKISFKRPIVNIEEQQLSFVILLTGIIFSLITGAYIKLNFINPFLLLAAASKKIKNGDLSCKIATTVKHPESKETIKTFNDMIDGLVEKNELRKNFVTNLTHDLRTPLLAQERAIELIINEFESLKLTEQTNLAKGLDKNNKHLLRMVNFILEAYRFDSDEIKIQKTDVDLHNLVDQCCAQLHSLALDKNITLLNDIPDSFGFIKTDKDCLKRVFLNLMANAIDNISNNCEVKIEAQKCDDFIKINVIDNGTGISEKDIAYIFDRFYTGKSDERKIGSGLGLFVCKKLVELLGGEISVESQVNKFTKFIIKLPL